MLTKNDRHRSYRALEKIQRTRRANLVKLRESYGGWDKLAAAIGCSDSYLCQIAGPNPKRMFGEIAARNIEKSLGLPANYFDIAPGFELRRTPSTIT